MYILNKALTELLACAMVPFSQKSIKTEEILRSPLERKKKISPFDEGAATRRNKENQTLKIDGEEAHER